MGLQTLHKPHPTPGLQDLWHSSTMLCLHGRVPTPSASRTFTATARSAPAVSATQVRGAAAGLVTLQNSSRSRLPDWDCPASSPGLTALAVQALRAQCRPGQLDVQCRVMVRPAVTSHTPCSSLLCMHCNSVCSCSDLAWCAASFPAVWQETSTLLPAGRHRLQAAPRRQSLAGACMQPAKRTVCILHCSQHDDSPCLHHSSDWPQNHGHNA